MELAEAQSSIFISYRRGDAADAAGRVRDRLIAEFGEHQVFMDVYSIPGGSDFGEHIRSVLAKCQFFLALIGHGWIDASDGHGARRLESAQDWVRIELETAFAMPGLRIVPVLLSGASMPRNEFLPESLHPLTRLHARVVRRDPDFHRDMDTVVGDLRPRVHTPAPRLPTSTEEWRRIEGSLDSADYADFERHFRGTSEGMLASRFRRQLESWIKADQTNVAAIEAQLLSSPFEALAKLQREALAKALAERDARAAAAAEAERRRMADEQERKRKQAETELRRGPEIYEALNAAMSDKPVHQRVFRLKLPAIANWPQPEMVAIPPGQHRRQALSFTGPPQIEIMPFALKSAQTGSSVEIRPFALGKLGVTFAEWDAALAAGADLHRPADAGSGRGAQPVVNVSRADARMYLDWLNVQSELQGEHAWRLPTAAEQEYARSSGGPTFFDPHESQNAIDDLLRRSHHRRLGVLIDLDAGKPNLFGVQDVNGKIEELTETGVAAMHWDSSGGGLVFPVSALLLADESRREDLGFRIARTL